MRAGNMLNPTPVVLVSCGSSPEEYNIVTVAWTGTVCSDPPLCYISLRPSRLSYDLIKQSGEFVINLVSQEMAAVTDWCGVKSGRQYHKFLETGLTPVRGKQVTAPIISEAPVNIECRVKEIIPLGTHDMFLSEVLAVHAQNSLFNPKTDALELQRANLLTYSHGHYYNLGKILGKFGFSVEKK
ncbi:MAG: flavin reductase family protein [Bacteroidales bacterium]|nr:flavin reductase family protein [Bacteroidales bacterium]